MDPSQPLEPLKWNALKLGAELPRGAKEPQQADAYVTRGEMQRYQRKVYALMCLLIELSVSSAVEIEAGCLDIHLN